MDLKPSLYENIITQIDTQLRHVSVILNKICKTYGAVSTKIRFHLSAPASIIDFETMFKSGKKKE
jgi:hypothetical protein